MELMSVLQHLEGQSAGQNPPIPMKLRQKNLLRLLGEICKICEVPTLEEYGVDREEFFKVIGKMAQDAYDSGSPGNTRKAVTIEDMEMIYRKLWEK